MASENGPSGADLSSVVALAAADPPETVHASHEVPLGTDAGSSQASPRFYQDDRVSERVKRWADSPNAFFRHVAPGLENKKLLNSISTTAVKDIGHFQDMQLYNDATSRIFSVFENHRENWLNSMQQWALPGVRAPVQPLVDTLQWQQSSQPIPSCSNTSRGLPMVSIPSLGAQEPVGPAPTSPTANPETSIAQGPCSDVTQKAIVSEDIHGAEWRFDIYTIVSLLDTSGIMRQVRVGALAEGRSGREVITPNDASTVASYMHIEYTDGA
ncbi:hypothetical protein CEP54_015066 [Fusarium duplospermum]|uniref:Uncharacterized protein n=1 Tax=Fusarium duplospermum TaxID=1325734 RepID=A0A428NRT2_9HYPO|nr:hypothetical protein CEP54_015066 [Fusarium duplospermum]